MAVATIYGTNTISPPCTDPVDVGLCQRETIANLEVQGYTITYEAADDDWFVVSGRTVDRWGTYQRWYPGDGSLTILSFDYPRSEADGLDAVTTELSTSLTPVDLDVAYCDEREIPESSEPRLAPNANFR